MVRSRPFAAPVRAAAGLLVLLFGLTAGCSLVTGDSSRETARVQIESTDVSEATLVTSLLFGVESGDVLLMESDTQRIELPFDERVPLSETRRFYVSVAPRESRTATLRMRVWIDDDSWFDVTRTLDADDLPMLEFVYRFSQPVL